MDHPLLGPMTAHVAYSAALYGLLTIARAPTVWGIGRTADGANPLATLEKRLSANLSNQFEWPLFFHVACSMLIATGGETRAALALAWVFVAGRLAHGAVQILTTNVRLRGIVFMINFLAVLGLWALAVGAGR
jgi:hypothetical protein